MRGLAMTGLLISVYAGAWMLRREVGLVKPCANLRYFYYSDDEFIDRVAYGVFWPAMQIEYHVQGLQHGRRVDIHWRNREPFVLPTEP